MKAISFFMSVALAAAPVLAADREPQINIIFSAENATCAAWTSSAGNKLVRQQYEIWARGFASGHNYATPLRQVKVGAFPSGDEFNQYFDQYCRDYPQQSFVAGAIHLVEQLAATSSSAKPVPPKKAPAPVSTK